MSEHQQSSLPNDRYRRLSRYVFFGFLAVAGYFLLVEHRAHLVPFLPFLLLAACPLMHLFHRGHQHGGSDDSDSDPRPPSNTAGGARH